MTANLSLWWQGITILEKIYWCLAVPFSVLFIIQTILTFTGGDAAGAEGDADVAVDSDSGIEFQFLSIKNLIAFFTLFGWVGIVTFGSGVQPFWSVVLATLAGLLMMVLMATLMYFMGKLTENGTLEVEKAIGKSGTVYLTIPPQRRGMGKVQINLQGFQTLDALSDEDEELSSGTLIEVTGIIDGDFLLVKRSSK